MNKKKEIRLTASQWKYLITLDEICNTTGANVRCKDIADALGFAKPSVHKMISTISSMGLIKKPLYGTVSITDRGQEFMEKYMPYYHTMFHLFVNVLKFPENNAKDGATALLAEISEEHVVTICETIQSLNKKNKTINFNF